MLEDKIREVVLSPKRISSIVFSYNSARYRANVTSSRIVLTKKNPKNDVQIAEYDIKTGEDSWYLDHVCKSKSFNKNETVCHACNTPESRLLAHPDNIEILAASSKYTPELAEILCHDLINYIKKYESSVKNV